MVEYGLYRFFLTGDYARSNKLYSVARATAFAARDASLEMDLLFGEEQVRWHARREPRPELASRAAKLAEVAEDPGSRMRAHCLAARMTFDREFAVAKRHAERAQELAAKIQNRHIQGVVGFSLAQRYLWLGDWELARREINLHLEFHESAGLRLLRVELAWATGDVAEARELIDQATPSAEATVIAHVATALVLVNLARYVETDRWMLRAQQLIQISEDMAAKRTAADECRIVSAAGMIGVIQNDKTACQRAYQLLRRLPVEEFATFSGMAAERELGLLAESSGELDAAAQHFEAAMEACESKAFRPELAWCCSDYADLLLRRARATDVVRAAALLERGMEIARDLHMTFLQRHISSRLEPFTSMSSRGKRARVVAPDGLTAREVEVLRFVARGHSNQEVAYALSISSKTVATHLGNAYGKIGAANRAQATTYINHHGLLDPESAGDE